MHDAPPTLIVADHDDALCRDLAGQLLADGLAAEPARSSAEIQCRAARGPDLLVLGDLERPTAALEFLRAIRCGDALGAEVDPWLPVVVVSAAAGEWVPLRAFEAGCDDFVRKPVAYLELRARVRAILRRTTPGVARAPRRVGALAIDPQRVEARYAGNRLELSRLEFALLCQLAKDPLRVFTKRELLRDVWGYRSEGATRTLDAHACRLRGKLQQAGAHGHIVNRRGVGYRLVDRAPALGAPGDADGREPGDDGAVVAVRRLGNVA